MSHLLLAFNLLANYGPATAEILQVLERQRHENEMLLRAVATGELT